MPTSYLITREDGSKRNWNRPNDDTYTIGEWEKYGNRRLRRRITFQPSNYMVWDYRIVTLKKHTIVYTSKDGTTFFLRPKGTEKQIEIEYSTVNEVRQTDKSGVEYIETRFYLGGIRSYTLKDYMQLSTSQDAKFQTKVRRYEDRIGNSDYNQHDLFNRLLDDDDIQQLRISSAIIEEFIQNPEDYIDQADLDLMDAEWRRGVGRLLDDLVSKMDEEEIRTRRIEQQFTGLTSAELERGDRYTTALDHRDEFLKIISNTIRKWQRTQQKYNQSHTLHREARETVTQLMNLREKYRTLIPVYGEEYPSLTYMLEEMELIEDESYITEYDETVAGLRHVYKKALQILDELGLVRTATFFTGAYLAYKFADPLIHNMFGGFINAYQYETDHIVPKELIGSKKDYKLPERVKATYLNIHQRGALQDSLRWSSRWAIGVPMYEAFQSGMYPTEYIVRSTPDDPIFWKEEFWGMFKYEKVTYWNLANYGYNYKSAVLALREYLKKQDRILKDIGDYQRYH